MQYPRVDPGHDRMATLDVETTAFDPADGEVVSVGVGVHDRETPATAARYETFHRDGSGEGTVIRRALDSLGSFDADALVTYNGREFDLAFLEARLAEAGHSVDWPAVATDDDRHVDLFTGRRHRASQQNVTWPSLEECLDAYGLPRPVTNTRFGEETGPAYLEALGGDGDRANRLRPAIDHYLTTDLEANVALYHADVGLAFEPHLLGTERSFATTA